MKPISRTQLQNLHTEEIVRKRNENIQAMVAYVYKQVNNTATSSSEKKKCIVQLEPLFPNKEVIQEISKDVISQLENLFPDCKVEFTKGIYTDNKRRSGSFIPIICDDIPVNVYHVIIVDWS